MRLEGLFLYLISKIFLNCYSLFYAYFFNDDKKIKNRKAFKSEKILKVCVVAFYNIYVEVFHRISSSQIYFQKIFRVHRK